MNVIAQALTYSLPVFFALVSIYAHLKYRRNAVLVGLIVLIACMSMAQVAFTMQGGWSGDFIHTLWVTVAASVLIFAGLTVMNRAALGLSGLFVPLVTATVFFAMNWQVFIAPEHAGPVKLAEGGAWIFIHVVTAVVTYALLTIAACASLAVWIKEHALKTRARNFLADSLPAVMAAEGLQLRLLMVAEAILAVSLLSGMAVEYVTAGIFLSFSHKETLSLLAFALIAFLLLAHYRFGVRGRRASRLLLLAYLLVVLGYPGVKFVFDVLVA